MDTQAIPVEHAGKTLTERLAAARLRLQWDSATKAHDRDQMIEILRRIEMPEIDAIFMVDTVLRNPDFYGV
jgi:hypothetical protein